jgi:hypothetical protein
MDNNEIYELDTARAKTPAERLRIVADLMDAQERGETIHYVDADGSLSSAYAGPYMANGKIRFVTKRRPSTAQRCCKTCNRIIEDERPVLVIPALELFELPMTEAPNEGATYVLFAGHDGDQIHWWAGTPQERQWLADGLIFPTGDTGRRIMAHIRNALAQAVAK